MSSGNVLDGLTERLVRIPGQYADQASALFTKVAEANGGRMMRRYQLTAREARRYIRPDGTYLLMEGFPAGFWVWRETGTKPHTIGPRSTRTGRVRRARGKGRGRPEGRLKLRGSDHPISGSVRHPGTSGRRAWTKTIAEVEPLLASRLTMIVGLATR